MTLIESQTIRKLDGCWAISRSLSDSIPDGRPLFDVKMSNARK